MVGRALRRLIGAVAGERGASPADPPTAEVAPRTEECPVDHPATEGHPRSSAAERWLARDDVVEATVEDEPRLVLRGPLWPWDLAEENRRLVVDAIEAAGARFFDVADPDALASLIAVPAPDWPVAVEALLASAREHGSAPLYVELTGGRGSRTSLIDDVSRDELTDVRELSLFTLRRMRDSDPVQGQASQCRVQRWDVDDEGDAVAPRSTGQLTRVSLELLTTMNRVEWRRERRRLATQLPSPLSPQGPIDIVYLWVDGSDPAWAARMRAAREAQGRSIGEDAGGEKRFRDRGELRASVRSLLLNAPWFDHLYIVTDRQTPQWLDTAHERVTVVDHREIFSRDAVLPTFNSRAIGSRLHHIPGLAEQYIIMNDDLFFNRPTGPGQFFTGGGGVVVPVSSSRMPVIAPERFGVIEGSRRNSALLIERDFGRTPAHLYRHTPIPQLRSLLHELEERYPEVFSGLENSQFRGTHDHEVNAWLHHNVALLTGRGVAGNYPYRYVNTSRASHWELLRRLQPTSRVLTFCINDTGDDRSDELETWLANYFPLPSPVEMTGR